MQDWFCFYNIQFVLQMLGSMSQKNCSNPSAFERAQYMKPCKATNRGMSCDDLIGEGLV